MDADASSEMERVLGTKPAKTSQDRGWGILEAHRWSHGALHQNTAPMAEHVVMRYFDTPRRIERATGRTRLRAVTANDTVTIIPAGLDADWDIYGGLEVVHLYIPQERLQRISDYDGNGAIVSLRDAVAKPDDRLTRLLALLAEELERPDAHSLYADALSEAICIHLLRAHGPGEAAAPGLASSGFGLAPWQVARIEEFVRANLDRQISLRELASLIGLSAKYFCSAFHRATGQAPHAFAQQLRIARAKALLADKSRSIVEVALDSGYASQSAFTAAFRRATGRTPAEWRRLCE